MHTLQEVSELFDYWYQEATPPTNEILSAVYKVKKPMSLKGVVNEEEFNHEFYSREGQEIIGSIGQTERIDSEMKESLYFAKLKLEKMKLVH